MADAKQVLIWGGIGLGVIGLISLAFPAQSKIAPTRPLPAPPGGGAANLPPVPPPIGPQNDAIAAAIAAALAAEAAASIPQASRPAAPQGPLAGQALPLPNPLPLVQGQRYRARLELSGFETLADRAMLQTTFEGTGFSSVTIYTTLAELPSGWPAIAVANVTPNSRWAEGVWNKPSQLVPKPPQILNAFIAPVK